MALTKVSSDMVSPDPTNASNLSSGDVPLAQLGNAPATDTTTLEDDIALLGFKVAVNGSLAKYNLVDQTEDAFVDATGIDASASTGETRNASKYYSGKGISPVVATGGTVTIDGDYTIHSFTATGAGTFTTDTAQSVDLLVVAGGGAGGYYAGGGGGAGGYISTIGHSVTAASHSITVGAGGPAISSNTYSNGLNSQFGAMTAAVGGGGGGSYSSTSGQVGGSGGGNFTTTAGGAGTAGQGNAGGTGKAVSSQCGGGGGGAGGVGTNSSSNDVDPNNLAGNGGVGLSNSITGSAVFYAGGGGGGRGGSVISLSGQGEGGNGGGGRGTSGASNNAAVAGTANTGGGGGAGGWPTTGSAAGGIGVVILRRATGVEAYSNMVLQSNSTTAETTATKGDIVMTYTDGSGTATLNTDITAEFSADNGSNWTSMTLAAQGTTGSASPHFIVSAHNVTAGVSGTGMKYRIKTLNQSAAKETRIQAVSLGWS